MTIQQPGAAGQVPQPPPAQIVYVQAPPATLTPIQQAQLDNSAAWRTTGIICIVLLLTLVLSWVIPFVLLSVLISNSSRMNRAQREMTSSGGGQRAITPLAGDGRSDARWVLAGFTAVVAVLALTGGIIGNGGPIAILVGLGGLAGAALLAPWRPGGPRSAN